MKDSFSMREACFLFEKSVHVLNKTVGLSKKDTVSTREACFSILKKCLCSIKEMLASQRKMTCRK